MFVILSLLRSGSKSNIRDDSVMKYYFPKEAVIWCKNRIFTSIVQTIHTKIFQYSKLKSSLCTSLSKIGGVTRLRLFRQCFYKQQ